MDKYFIFEKSLLTTSAFTFSENDLASRDILWRTDPPLGTHLASSLLYIKKEDRGERQKYKNYKLNLTSEEYGKVKIPPIGLMPGEDQPLDIYKPNGSFLDYTSLGCYWFVSSRMRFFLEEKMVSSIYHDAYIEIKGKRQIGEHYLWTPLVALDATDRIQSIFEMDDHDESVLEGVRPAEIDKIQRLVLDSSKIPNNTPFFLLGCTFKEIVLIRQDIAEEIQSLGYTGMEFKRIEDCEWMY
jgi:hypothetical protein